MTKESITVLVDTREQYPLLFPAHITIEKRVRDKRQQLRIPVKVKKQKLDYGDYALEGYEHCCIFERKSGTWELTTNLYNDKDMIRACKAFKRLADNCVFPYLILESTPSQLLKGKIQNNSKAPESLMYRLASVIAKYRLSAMWVPKPSSSTAKRDIGTAVLHIMLAHSKN